MIPANVRKYNTVTKCKLCHISMLNAAPRVYYCDNCQKRINKRD